jgi:hypothetical protein
MDLFGDFIARGLVPDEQIIEMLLQCCINDPNITLINKIIASLECPENLHIELCNLIIRALTLLEQYEQAFMIYKTIRMNSICPNDQTYTYLLEACRNDDTLHFLYDEIQSSSVSFNAEMVSKLLPALRSSDKMIAWLKLLCPRTVNFSFLESQYKLNIPPPKTPVKYTIEFMNIIMQELIDENNITGARMIFDNLRARHLDLNEYSYQILIQAYLNLDDHVEADILRRQIGHKTKSIDDVVRDAAHLKVTMTEYEEAVNNTLKMRNLQTALNILENMLSRGITPSQKILAHWLLYLTARTSIQNVGKLMLELISIIYLIDQL